MHAVELIRCAGFLSDWEQLNPCHSTNFFDYIRHLLPIKCWKRLRNIYIQALEFSFLSVLLELLLFCHCTFWNIILGWFSNTSCGFWSRFDWFNIWASALDRFIPTLFAIPIFCFWVDSICFFIWSHGSLGSICCSYVRINFTFNMILILL